MQIFLVLNNFIGWCNKQINLFVLNKNRKIFYLILLIILILYSDIMYCIDQDINTDLFVYSQDYRDYNYKIVFEQLDILIIDDELYNKVAMELQNLANETKRFDIEEVVKILKSNKLDVSINKVREWIILSRK